jgi:hypothetical protein
MILGLRDFRVKGCVISGLKDFRVNKFLGLTYFRAKGF